jgi:hypothetical protein
VEKTFGTALLGSIGVRHVGIARGMPDDMNTNDPFNTSEGFTVCLRLELQVFKNIFTRVRTTCSGAAGPQTPGKSGKDSI